ncbi:MAG: hypothetical protein DBY38_02090 [Clostridium cadaveris]|uniref:Prohead protease n=1 Tax=Clostridium cadaveris TaxID=1529 RepID=A0A316MAN0_9CLOT|nr:MAG: hypothetical protein DBY38_02090 [Clostridium cadaveris]
MIMREKLKKDLFDKRITDIVANRIYLIHVPEGEECGDIYIEYMFYNKSKTDYSSNRALYRKHYIQIDIFSIGDFTDLENALEEVLQEKGYCDIESVDGFEEKTKLYTLKYRCTYKERLNA